MKKILPVMLILLTCVSCSKSYVGREVPSYGKSWCNCETLFVTHCRIESGSYDFDFIVSKQILIESGRLESKIEGTAIWNGASEPGSQSESQFRFILANGRVITENITFQLESAARESKEIPFQKTFISGPFEAVTISWNTSVNNQSEFH
jgi:hypothetical protein